MASVAHSAPEQHTPEEVIHPLIAPGNSYKSITEKISDVILSGRVPAFWYFWALIAFVFLNILGLSATVLLLVGTGIWGITIPIGWGFAIINFVWWIGIGHAGTLISAVLLLLNQKWRTSINRFAETMTIFAVRAPAVSLLHTGCPGLPRIGFSPIPARWESGHSFVAP
jgi:molybdopterin-containing oxidoreductase family membrane subunit